MIFRPVPAALSLVALLLIRTPVPAGQPDRAALDAILNEALKAWQAPGMAVAVVHKDEVVYLKGVGVRERGGKDAVTPDTIFGIGSCTKAFAATALGLLVDEGKASWDDPVRKHVPFFRLLDPLADRDVTLRDLVCHRTGLARHDLLWYRAPWPPEESVRRMAHLPLRHSFRSAYEYNNLAYLTAGLAITSAAKMPWQDFVRKRLFEPLGMSNAVFTRTAALKSADHATPHHREPDGKVHIIPWYTDDSQIRASGSIKTGVRDLSRWVRLQLNGGTLGDKRIVPAAVLKETHTPQIVVPLSRALKMAGTAQASYGLGWGIFDYRGHALLAHGGAVDGFRARIVLAPKDRLGVVVLTNVDEMGAAEATAYALLDHFLGLPKKDWHGFYLGESKRAEDAWQAQIKKRAAARHTGTKPSRELAAFAGSYHDPAYGTVRIRHEGGRLVLAWSSFRVSLEHYHFDTFVVSRKKGEERNSLTDEMAVFDLGEDGMVTTLHFLGRTFERKKSK